MRMLNDQQMDAVRALTINAKPSGRYIPEGFLAFERSQRSMELMFEGLMMHYMEAIASGRGKVWADAGHSIIDLLAHGPLGVATPQDRRET